MTEPAERVLYVTWDGPKIPYLRSLFLPVFAEVQKQSAHRFHVLQFTWDDAAGDALNAQACAAAGVGYTHGRVIHNPVAVATPAMMLWGALKIVRLADRLGTTMLMPRSMVPAAMVLLASRLRPSLKLCFESDGLAADERVDFGGWSATGGFYRTFRAIEAAMLKAADSVLVRTQASLPRFLERAGPKASPGRFLVVPNGKDPVQFSPGTAETRLQTRRRLGLAEDALVVVYAGSIGPQYFPGEMARLFSQVLERERKAHWVVLTGNGDPVREAASRAGLPEAAFRVQRVDPDEVPAVLAAADVGLALRAQAPSQCAVCPIKVAEYLLCGLPVISTRGIGDVETQLPAQASLLLDSVVPNELSRAAEWVTAQRGRREPNRALCREAGLKHFSLAGAADGYRRGIELASSGRR